MQLSGLAARTQDSYVRAVEQLARHYDKAPDQISQKELRDYFLYLRNEKQVSRSTFTIALCGIKRFFEKTLNRHWVIFDLLRPPKEKKLPIVLSQQEVHRLLASLRQLAYRTCLTTIYSCGLRLQESLHVEVTDIVVQKNLFQEQEMGYKNVHENKEIFAHFGRCRKSKTT